MGCSEVRLFACIQEYEMILVFLYGCYALVCVYGVWCVCMEDYEMILVFCMVAMHWCVCMVYGVCVWKTMK